MNLYDSTLLANGKYEIEYPDHDREGHFSIYVHGLRIRYYAAYYLRGTDKLLETIKYDLDPVEAVVEIARDHPDAFIEDKVKLLVPILSTVQYVALLAALDIVAERQNTEATCPKCGKTHKTTLNFRTELEDKPDWECSCGFVGKSEDYDIQLVDVEGIEYP